MSNDSAILESFGNLIYHDALTFGTGFVLYGAYLVVFPVCLWFIIAVRPLSCAAKILLAAMILAFTATTVQFIDEATRLLEEILIYLTRTDIPLHNREAVWISRFTVLVVLDYWPQLVTYAVSDTIVVWRAWVLYPRNTIVHMLLSTFTAFDLGLWVYAQAHLSKHALEQSTPYNPATDVRLSTAANFMSLGTNLLATGFISFKAWQYFRLMDGSWQGKLRTSQASRILLILIETGVAWMSIQITVCVIQQLDVAAFTDLDTATAIIETASTYLAGILPAITVIIVRSQNSFESWTITDDPPLHSNHQISTLRFGVKESTGSTLDADPGLSTATRTKNFLTVADKGRTETSPV
ncbi:hypothetical protein C8R44DRAFT_929163 [Mycena epipterygia]|nr:hypothetical protein C8R44DRAFT_929163 [Mycena epipterygia]